MSKLYFDILRRLSALCENNVQFLNTTLEHNESRSNRHKHISLSTWGVPYRKETWEISDTAPVDQLHKCSTKPNSKPKDKLAMFTTLRQLL